MKSKILLLTTMLASASFAFVQAQTITRQGITFEITSEKDAITIAKEDSGQIYRNTPEDYNFGAEKSFLIQKKQYVNIKDQKRTVKVKATKVNGDIQAGQIISWEASTPTPPTTTIKNYNTSITSFGIDAYDNFLESGEFEYYVFTESKEYELYDSLCQAATPSARRQNIIIAKGSTINRNVYPVDDYYLPINTALYYYVSYKSINNKPEFHYKPILSTSGSYTLETTMENCTDKYIPTEIADELAWNVATEGKIGKVTGIVNNKRITEAVARGERNFDFTGATILGEVNVDVPANKLAYFAKGTEATGTNVVVNITAEKYLIKDNGEEIYVSKAFTADEAIYERNFNAGSYATLVLPFKAENTGEIFERQAKLDGYDATANKISCIMTETLAANVPYLIQISSDATEINEINASIQKTGSPKSSVYNGLQLVGTYAPIAGTALTNNYIFSTTGVIGRLKASSTLKPGRCYFNYTPASSSSAKIDNATIEIRDEEGSIIDFIAPNFDEEATDIDGVVENSKVVSVQYISANGQISNAPVKGMNLVKKTYADGTVETTKVAY